MKKIIAIELIFSDETREEVRLSKEEFIKYEETGCVTIIHDRPEKDGLHDVRYVRLGNVYENS